MDKVLQMNANDKSFVRKRLDFTGQTKEASIPLASFEGKKMAEVMNPYSKENRQISSITCTSGVRIRIEVMGRRMHQK